MSVTRLNPAYQPVGSYALSIKSKTVSITTDSYGNAPVSGAIASNYLILAVVMTSGTSFNGPFVAYKWDGWWYVRYLPFDRANYAKSGDITIYYTSP